MSGLRVEVKGVPEAEKLLEDLSGRELQNRTRRGARKGAGVFRKQIRSQASARSDLPRTFRKTATRNHRNPVGTSVGPDTPLWNIFEGGATGHTISPSAGHGGVLTNQGFAQSRARAGGEAPFFATHPVWHPGMGARPLTVPIFEQRQDEAGKAAMDEILAGLH